MTHPLTEKMIEEMSHLVEMSPWYEKYPDDYDYDCLVEGMRAAADWQLEQVIKWLSATKSTVKLCPSVLAVQLEQAMRPQVVDLPQANSDVCGEEGIERARQRTFEENDELMRKLSDS
jgi:predicted Zn-dependent protease